MADSLSPQDLDLVTRTIIGEAGNQSDLGQAAVAHVILNRLQTGKWGNTPTDVVLARGQFEPWQTRGRELLAINPKSPEYQRAAANLNGVLSGAVADPTDGATHFLNPNIVMARRGSLPNWASGQPINIGDHAFYAPEGRVANRALAYTQENGNSDPLGDWAKSLPRSTPVNQPAAPVQEAPADDLLGAWASSVAPPKTNTAPPAATPVAPTEGTPGQVVANLLESHQGPGITNAAIRGGASVVRGIGDVADTLAQGIGYVGETGANKLASMGVISPETAKSVADWRGRINTDIASDNTAFTRAAGDNVLPEAGRVVGQIAGSAPFLMGGGAALNGLVRGAPIVTNLATRPMLNAAVRGGLAGGAATALTSSTSDQPMSAQVGTGTGIGALLGPAGVAAGKVGAKVMGGAVDPAVAQLARVARDKFGIGVTAGQISENPTIRFLDSVLQRLPFTGYGARTADQQGAFNRAISQTFGEDAEKVTPDLIRAAKARIGTVFDDVATRTGDIRVDNRFVTGLQNVVQDARSVLPASEVAPLESQIRDVVSKIDPTKLTLSPETYQALTRKGAPLDRAMQSKDPNIRHYAGQIRDLIDDVMERSAPPDVLADLVQARSHWKALRTVEPLAKKSTTGDISPRLLLGKVNQSYSGNGADLGQLGRIGQRFIAEPPSSGTAERLSLMYLMNHAAPALVGLTGAGGLGAATYFDPDSWQRNLVLGVSGLALARGAGGALRSTPLANLMINRGLRAAAPSATGGLKELINLSLPAGGSLLIPQRRQAPASP